ncbi:ABC transporter substrate-binding protein [Nocardia sp. 2]|uniref:non-specific serine/threonine protein kinase n=1 Tax=Nocardia acididurans TaxID=2802282 RepID=A0ABS1M0Z0_9NOCA|nr:bifunctional serine/threonine-protein kinase/ABC transporter substrate-binding protein [Nocardia acididurans]MBL1074338.1 ABC transporter substrate-binding protein [Nocardia acididurans]
MLRPGDVFAGYVIERRLGGGGMGEVYLARHPRLPRLVAVKLLGRDFLADNEVRARFEREAELVARLDHPNIVSVFDRGVDDDRLWISMQYIDGADASTLARAALPPERAVWVIAEVAKALDYAHAMGVLHRDVKPANIMLARPAPGYGERILLADFGIGRMRGDTNQLTRTGSLTVTLAYASPEQLSAAPLDHRSDQYSLACTLFWLLCGSSPFESGDAAAVIAGHLYRPPPPVSARRPGLPHAMDAVLARALAKLPADRFTSCTEFVDAVRGSLAPPEPAPPHPVSPHRPEDAPTLVTPGPSPAEDAPTQRTSPPPRAENAPPLGDLVPTSAENPLPQRNSVPADSAEGTQIPGAAGRRRGRLIALAVGLVVVLAVTVGIVWAIRDSASSDRAGDSGAAGGSAALTMLGMQALRQIDGQGRINYSWPSGVYPPMTSGAACAPLTIAVAGPMSGADATLGSNVLNGANLAVGQFNERNPECQITVREFDTQGDPAVAAQVIPALVVDPSVVALIGPVFTAETQAVGQVLSDAGLPFLTPSATGGDLARSGWRTYFQGVANGDGQGVALGRFVGTAEGRTRVCVISDASEYGVRLAGEVTTGLGAAVLQDCAMSGVGEQNATAAASTVAGVRPDAIVYTGVYTEAAALLRQLHDAGVSVPLYTGEGGTHTDFVSDSTASGVTVSCMCGPAPAQFRSDYQTLTGSEVGAYSVEGYDLTAIVLRAIASGPITRADLVTQLQSYTGDGLARTYHWTATGELADQRYWIYRIP